MVNVSWALQCLGLRSAKLPLPKTVLVCRTDNLGDFITTLPICERLKRNGVSQVFLLGKEQHRSLTANNPYIDGYFSIDDTPEVLPDNIRWLGFDCLINTVNHNSVFGLLKKLRHIPCRIGPASNVKFLPYYTHPIRQSRSQSIKSEAAYTLDLCALFDCPVETPAHPAVYFTDEELERFQADFTDGDGSPIHFDQFAVVHPGMRGSALNISDALYAEIVHYLAAQGLQVLLTGLGDAEHRKIEAIIQQAGQTLPNSVCNMCNRFSLRELACLLSRSRVFVGPSTGTTHLAAACGAPTVGFYPPLKTMSALRWAPEQARPFAVSPGITCPQSLRCTGSACPLFNCMDTIRPADVIKRIALALQRNTTLQ